VRWLPGGDDFGGASCGSWGGGDVFDFIWTGDGGGGLPNDPGWVIFWSKYRSEVGGGLGNGGEGASIQPECEVGIRYARIVNPLSPGRRRRLVKDQVNSQAICGLFICHR